MNLLQMSISGGILILAILVLRAILMNRVPKGTFLALWGIALLRLLLPFSVPSALSVYNLADSAAEALGITVGYREDFMGQSETGGMAASDMQMDGRHTMDGEASMDGERTMDGESSIKGEHSMTEMRTMEKGSSMAESGMGSGTGGTSSDMGDSNPKNAGRKLVSSVWCAGAVLCAAYFAASDIYLRKKYRTAVLFRNDFLSGWLSSHRLRRQISIRCSDRIQAPMTYGILHPVILLPQKTAGLTGSLPINDVRQLELILQHEFVHIRRFDNMSKLIAATALCIHWFNPLVWVMYFLFNRDLELACDESVVRGLGPDGRKAYALTLIDMEERKSGLSPMYSGFSKNAIEERITAIMKMKKITFGAILLAAMLVASVATVFATSAMERNRGGQSISVPEFQNRAWWTQKRQNAGKGLQTGEDEARGTPGTEEDYLSLLALKTADYKAMFLDEFNQGLLVWANEDYDRMERIGIDDAWGDIQMMLGEDELSFVQLTVVLSGLENGEHIPEDYVGFERMDERGRDAE